MEKRNTPVRKPRNSTADLLTWPETPTAHSPASAPRSRGQPSDGIRKTVFGGQVTDEEVETLNKRKPCSGYKMKEMTGSGIFKPKNRNVESENEDSANKTGLRMYQQTLAGVSHINFGDEQTVSPKKTPSLPEAAKQRELSGNQVSNSDATSKKQFCNAKNRELSGNAIFAPPPEIQQRPLSAQASAFRETMGETTSRNGGGGVQRYGGVTEETVVKTSKKLPNQRSSEPSRNNIFNGDARPASTDRPISSAKLREMSGSNIFADGKAESRDFLGGPRRPPGGESSIALV